MKLANKFELNTKDFKIYFDNMKKTHICENLDTGEKTNLGCLGILMQMGILTPTNNNQNPQDISSLIKRIDELEEKIDNIVQGPYKEKKPKQEKPEKQPEEDIKEHIMETVLEKAEETEDSDVNQETNEEVDNWMNV